MTGELYTWLLDTTVKGSILIVAVAILQRLIAPYVDARWRHLLWVVVLIRLLLPAAPSSSFSAFNLLPSHEPVVAPHVARIGAVTPGSAPALAETIRVELMPYRNWLPWIVAIWLSGALILATRMAIGAIRMQRRIPRGTALRTESSIPLIESDAVRTPALHGVFRPVLLLPRGFTGSFSEEELRHVVLHELWHVRRMDVAVSWLLAVVQCLHWFNPLVWFAGSRIREERELACDELALSLLEEDERPDYGRTILKLIERCRPAPPLPAAVGIVDRKERMKRRLMMIASFRKGTRFTALFLSLVATVAVAGLTDGETKRERHFIRTIDPAAHASAQKLHQRVSFELTGGSLNDLLGTISNKTGVPVTQHPDLATLPVQNARFTIKAENVPAHLVLMEALMPFELSATPGADVITIEQGAGRPHMRIMLRNGDELEVAGNEAKHKVFVERKKIEDIGVEEKVEERVMVRARAMAGETAGGSRNLTIVLEENGVTSEGKLSIQIDK